MIKMIQRRSKNEKIRDCIGRFGGVEALSSKIDLEVQDCVDVAHKFSRQYQSVEIFTSS